MSIVFSDTALKQTSKDILLLPFLINAPLTGYIAQKSNLVAGSNDLLADDNNKKVFYDFWKDVVLHYHNELELLNSLIKTNYSDVDLINAGNQSGVHYPNTNRNIQIAPLIISSMNGNPSSTGATINESSRISDVSVWINYIKNGFTDGASTSVISGVTATQFTVSSGASPIVNNRIVLHDGTHSVFGFVTNVSGSTVTYTKLGGVLISAGICDNFLSGFTDSQRSHATTNYANDVMLYFQSQIDSSVVSWNTNMTSQKSILDTNGDYAPRKAHVQAASANIFSMQLSLSGWQGLPYNSRYINSGLLILENDISARTSQVSSRITEINNDLGATSQDTVGVFSGSGVYYELTKIINIRISRTGSLCAYNSSLLGLAYYDKLIADTNSQLAQYQVTMVVKTITQDVAINDLIIKVDTVSQLTVGDSVKLFDNDSIVYIRTISNISGLNITLNLAMLASLQTSKIARLVKEL